MNSKGDLKKMKVNKLMVLPVVIIIALAGTGVAFAHWKDQMYVHGDLHGATLKLAVFEIVCNDFWMNPATGEPELGEYLGKDNAQCDAWGAERFTDPHTDKSGFTKVIVEIFGAYPSYRAHTSFRFHNIGTIPIWICSFDIEGAKYTKDDDFVCPLYLIITSTPPGDITGDIYEDLDYLTNPGPSAGDKLVINIYVENGRFPFQLDPCQDDKGEVDLHFKQGASQCHRYKLEMRLWGVQWNKECPDALPEDYDGDDGTEV
jgi:hypothetical protein